MHDIHSIKPVIETPILSSGQKIFLWIFFIALIIAALSVVGFFIWKKYFKKEINDDLSVEIEPEEQIDYKEESLAKFKKLKKIIEDGRIKDFYFEITEVIRWYLQGIYKVNFEDMTTEEILSSNLPDNVKKELAHFLNAADMAKFANKNLEKNTAEKIYEIGFQYIKNS